MHVDVHDDHPRGRAGRNGKVRAWPLSPPRLDLPGISGRLVETTLGNRAFPAWHAREDRHIEPRQLARDKRQRYALAETGEHRSDRRGPARDRILRRARVAYLNHRQTSFRRRPPVTGWPYDREVRREDRKARRTRNRDSDRQASRRTR